jgi:hypothetical protein
MEPLFIILCSIGILCLIVSIYLLAIVYTHGTQHLRNRKILRIAIASFIVSAADIVVALVGIAIASRN